MKKLLWILTAVSLIAPIGTPSNLFAETEASVEAGESHLVVQAGVVASMKGEVKVKTPSAKSSHPLTQGDRIFMGDKIETGEDGALKVLLMDQTFFTLGPSNTVTIDEFIYDPANAENKASMVKGVLRAVSGKVAQKDSKGESHGGSPNASETDPRVSSSEISGGWR